MKISQTDYSVIILHKKSCYLLIFFHFQMDTENLNGLGIEVSNSLPSSTSILELGKLIVN